MFQYCQRTFMLLLKLLMGFSVTKLTAENAIWHIIHLLRFYQLPVPLWDVHCSSTHPGFLLPTHPSSCHIFPAAQSIPYPWQRDLLLSSESCRGRWGSRSWGWGKETRLAADRNRICGASFSLTWWEQLGFPVWLVSDPESCNPI